MSDFVWVKLDRADRERVRDWAFEAMGTNDWLAADDELLERLAPRSPALSEPSEDRIEAAAQAIYEVEASCDKDGLIAGWATIKRFYAADELRYKLMARAALAALYGEGEA